MLIYVILPVQPLLYLVLDTVGELSSTLRRVRSQFSINLADIPEIESGYQREGRREE